MQSAFVRFLSMGLTGLLVRYLLAYILKKNTDELLKNIGAKHIVVHLPSALRWVGWITFAFFAGFLFMFFCAYPGDAALPDAGIVFGLFALGGLAMVWSAAVWRIDVVRNSDEFVYRTCFLRTYRVKYADCVKYVEYGRGDYILKTKEKTFFIDALTVNAEFFEAELQKNGVKIVGMTEKKWEIRNYLQKHPAFVFRYNQRYYLMGRRRWALRGRYYFEDEEGARQEFRSFRQLFEHGRISDGKSLEEISGGIRIIDENHPHWNREEVVRMKGR